MGHLLSTTNPDAAAKIQNGRSEPDLLPGVGASVVFWPQGGISRMGRTSFPAIVAGVRLDEQSIDLIIFFDAGDFIDELRVPRRSEHNRLRCWDYPENMVMRSLDTRLEEPGGLRGVVASLDQAVFGDYDRPPISLVSILEDFEKRLAALKKLVGDKK